MKPNTKSRIKPDMYRVWYMTGVAWEVSVEKRECSLIGGRTRVIYEKRKLLFSPQ